MSSEKLQFSVNADDHGFPQVVKTGNKRVQSGASIAHFLPCSTFSTYQEHSVGLTQLCSARQWYRSWPGTLQRASIWGCAADSYD